MHSNEQRVDAPNGVNLSVLTVHYKSSEFRSKLVESLSNYTDSYEFLEHWNDNENLGFARATNILIRRSKGRYIILLNPDSVVTPNWATALVDTAERDGSIGIVASKLMQFDGLIDSTGHDLRKWPAYTIDRGQGEEDKQQYDAMTELESCNFGCALVKRSLIEKVGLLDERFFLYCEDLEYCLRARKAGWRVVYCPQSIVYHQRHGSGPNKWFDTSRRCFPYIIRKYYSRRVLAKWLALKTAGTLAGLKNRDLAYARLNVEEVLRAIW